jgi:5-methylcytosine-specific restriction endonuclease McrA
LKICSKCSENRELTDFYKDKNAKGGFRAVCKFCDVIKAKKWNTVNKEKHCSHQKLYRESNRQATRDQRYKYAKANVYKINALSAKHRAEKIKATIGNYDLEIQQFYKDCPKGFHVDHVVPLRGKTVCGLHVPWNLQIITSTENLSKGNKLYV